MSDKVMAWYDTDEWWPVYDVRTAATLGHCRRDPEGWGWMKFGEIPAETSERWADAMEQFKKSQAEIKDWIKLQEALEVKT